VLPENSLFRTPINPEFWTSGHTVFFFPSCSACSDQRGLISGMELSSTDPKPRWYCTVGHVDDYGEKYAGIQKLSSMFDTIVL